MSTIEQQMYLSGHKISTNFLGQQLPIDLQTITTVAYF